MKIKLAFIINRETFRIEIQEKNIWYTDRRWDKAIRLIPKDDNFLKKILFSRGKIPPIIKELFNLTVKEQEEYDNAKDAMELTDICMRDCKRYGAKLLKKEIVEEISSTKTKDIKDKGTTVNINKPSKVKANG